MNHITTEPEYIFETSWEVCNRVGGIYTVLSTRAATMQKAHKDKVVFFGPDVWQKTPSPYFIESDSLLAKWKSAATAEGLHLRVGRWNVPGKPIAVLVDFQDYFVRKNDIYGHVWSLYGVDSIAAYGDYDEASMFGYAAGAAMESLYRFLKLDISHPTVAHFNEWMTSFGLYYVKEHLPQVATLFTTHATSIGRSIAGNQKPLYDYFSEYNGDQMARELNMVAKHSTEKQAAHLADCFTTVSKITGCECAQLLEKKADVVTPNGFEANFVPKGTKFVQGRVRARALLRQVAETLLGYQLSDDILFIGTSGRYEYKNKGIDVFVETMKRLNDNPFLQKEMVAFIVVPAYISGARTDLRAALDNPSAKLESWNRITTHELYDYQHDPVLEAMRWFHITNRHADNVKVIFVPSYINGDDGIFNCSYYDLLMGFDITIFPSYYEPWGYTPLESVAFHIPTITTNLSGFGQWASQFGTDIMDGVGVIKRSDYNTYEVVAQITDMIGRFAELDTKAGEVVRTKAAETAEHALWKHFMCYYEEAYKIALLSKTALFK